MNYSKAFTLIELIVVIVIIAILSGVILFSISQYVNKGKDSNISGNLAVLIPAGEVFYNSNHNSYIDFCDPTGSGTVLKNAISQMPLQSSGAPSPCYSDFPTSTTNPAGVCCNVNSNGDSWAACARELTNPDYAYCVDSRGVKKRINNSSCDNNLTQCP